MKKIVLLSLVLVSSFGHATEITQDYAYGAEINIVNDESMFNRVDLNLDVYTQTISNSLDDVRVFNRNGQPVPFALVNVYEQNSPAQTIPMTVYPLDESHRINQNKALDEDDLEQYNININSKDIKISLDKSNNNKEKYSKTYLLQVPDNVTLQQGIRRLSIDFDETTATNWQATATLLYSYSLKDWTTAVANVPIMSLVDSNNDQSLTLNTIDIAPNYDYTANYWLLTLTSQNPIPEIKNINTLTKNGSEKIALYPIDFSLVSADKQQAIYQLPSQQPIKELSIELNNTRTVLPISIYYKSSDDDKDWRKLNDYIIRRFGFYDEPQRIMLAHSPLKIKQLLIKTINASFDEAPKIIAYRDRMNIVFNSTNNGPFILAWGSAKATPVSLTQQDLLSNSESVLNLPEANIGNLVKLAGASALTVLPESSSFPRWIIWLCLIAGAAFLVVLALKLIKEIKKTP